MKLLYFFRWPILIYCHPEILFFLIGFLLYVMRLYTNLSFPNVNTLSSGSFRYENGGTSIFWVHGELVLASKFYLICFHHCILKIKINDEQNSPPPFVNTIWSNDIFVSSIDKRIVVSSQILCDKKK